MYVCLCNGYRDAEIREVAAETGERCAEQVYLSLGNGPCCRSCLDCAQDIVDGVHARDRASEARRPQTQPQTETQAQPQQQPQVSEALLMAAE